jgi:hypothetical protein
LVGRGGRGLGPHVDGFVVNVEVAAGQLRGDRLRVEGFLRVMTPAAATAPAAMICVPIDSGMATFLDPGQILPARPRYRALTIPIPSRFSARVRRVLLRRRTTAKVGSPG